MCLYECLYMKNAILYQGNSLFHDIYRNENRPPITETKSVICQMHECGTKNRLIKMRVPKKSNELKREYVLWRRTPYDLTKK